MSSGSSPASSFAAYHALSARARLTWVQAILSNAVSPMRTRYGLARLPCTAAVTAPASMVRSITWPWRAYVRPRCSRPPTPIDSSTSMKRSDHQVCAIVPRLLRDLIPPSTRLGLDGGGNQLLTHGSFGQGEDLTQRAGGELGQPPLAVGDHQVGQSLLVLDHLIDLLRESADADELAHLHVPLLPDPERPVGGLILHRGVPPSVQVDDVTGRGE